MLRTGSNSVAVAVPAYGTKLMSLAEDLSYAPIRTEDIGWESFAGTTRTRALRRDLMKSDQQKMILLCYTAWKTNPIAHRLIEMQVNFVLGNGISLTSENEEVRQLIWDWWTDSYNNWPTKISQRLRDLYIYGEWVHVPFIDSKPPYVYVRDVQPTMIDLLDIDVDNHSEIDTITFKRVQTADGELKLGIPVKTIRQRLSIYGKDKDYTGEIFFFGINRTTDAIRGVSELFPVLDYLDLYDELLFARAEKIVNMGHMYYDMKFTGMNEQQIRAYLARETAVPPKPGTVYGHNENVEMSLVVPQMHADDHEKDVTTLKSFIISSMGWPGTYFDDSGAGRASAAEMAEPALKNIQNLQAQLGNILRSEINYMLYLAWKDGKLKSLKMSDWKAPDYQITFVRGSARGIQQIGPALWRIGQFLDVATGKLQAISKQEARRIIVSLIDQLAMSDAPISMDLPTDLDGPIVTPMPGTILGKEIVTKPPAPAKGAPLLKNGPPGPMGAGTSKSDQYATDSNEAIDGSEHGRMLAEEIASRQRNHDSQLGSVAANITSARRVLQLL